MSKTTVMAIAALIITSLLTSSIASAQQPGIKRTDFPRHDLSVPGREASQVLVEFAPGVSFPKHLASGRRARLCRRGHPGIRARWQASGDAERWRRAVHPG